MVDLGQKKVELSTFFYVQFFPQIIKKAAGLPAALDTIKNLIVGLNYLCCAYLFETSSQLITLKKASM